MTSSRAPRSSPPPVGLDLGVAVLLLVLDALALGILLLSALGMGLPLGARSGGVPSPWWFVALAAPVAASGPPLWRGGWFWAGGTQIVAAVLLAGLALTSAAGDAARGAGSGPLRPPVPGASAPGTARAHLLPVPRPVVAHPFHRLAAEAFERVDGGGAAGEAEEQGGDEERSQPAHT
ncbi:MULTISPECIES: hypothetical protein [unclassified Streptomyces]|uniref:hypothetical protein n=1 Tax=unclassified Streptomyces TaxID=2593676 RepID=UPI0036F6CDD1